MFNILNAQKIKGLQNFGDGYQIIGTFNVAINEHLCKYNVTKSVTFITETPYLHNCYLHLARNRNIL